MSLNTETNLQISVWFVCRSCELKFPFRTVDEILDHKKQKHFGEFQNTQCIVFEERKQDKPSWDQNSDDETKVFAEDDCQIDDELCSNAKKRRIFSSVIAEPSSPVSFASAVAEPADPSSSDELIPTYTNNAAGLNSPGLETEFNGEFDLFSVRSSSPDINSDHKSDLEADAISNGANNSNFVGAANNSKISKSNLTCTQFRNPPTKNPYVLIHRLTPNELSSNNWKDNSKTKNTLNTVDASTQEGSGPFFKPFFKFPEPDSDPDLDQADPFLTLREWLLKQKSQEHSTSSHTETVNIIRLEPDPTEMEEREEISEEAPIRCGLCRKYLESEAEVKIHVTHCWLQNKRRHCFCLPCNRTLARPQELKQHNKTFHPEPEVGQQKPRKTYVTAPVYSCHLCLNKYRDPYTLKQHLTCHFAPKTQEKRDTRAVCKICGRKFYANHHLKVHLMSHAEERPFVCVHNSNCKATFKTSAALRHHVLTHTESRLFPCPMEGCSKRFKTKRDLWGHLKSSIHAAERNWKCHLCVKAYTRRYLLKRHIVASHEKSKLEET